MGREGYGSADENPPVVHMLSHSGTQRDYRNGSSRWGQPELLCCIPMAGPFCSFVCLDDVAASYL